MLSLVCELSNDDDAMAASPQESEVDDEPPLKQQRQPTGWLELGKIIIDFN